MLPDHNAAPSDDEAPTRMRYIPAAPNTTTIAVEVATAIAPILTSESLPDYIALPDSSDSDSCSDEETKRTSRRQRYFAAAAAARRAATLGARLDTAAPLSSPPEDEPPEQWSNNPPEPQPLPDSIEERRLLWLPPERRNDILPDDTDEPEPLPGEWPTALTTQEARRALVLREVDALCRGPAPAHLKPATVDFIEGVIADHYLVCLGRVVRAEAAAAKRRAKKARKRGIRRVQEAAAGGDDALLAAEAPLDEALFDAPGELDMDWSAPGDDTVVSF